MKIKLVRITIFLFLVFSVFVSCTEMQSTSILDKNFDLAGEHSPETQYFVMESKLIVYSLDGKRVSTDIFRLHLKCVPEITNGKERFEYTCVEFSMKLGNASEVSIPALENWTYIFKQIIDKKGQLFGIDHGKFENLVDSNGNTIAPDKSYHVYNAFIDFHTFCNVFADSTPEGNGIQNLKRIGQKIIHYAAFSEPPVNLGSKISKGSFFKNGEITLEFKGLSVVNGNHCALIGYDSGESTFKMIIKPMPNMEIRTVGSSHYHGDIYKDLQTKWVQKATMIETVVSETILPMPPNKQNSVAERNILIRNVSNKEFDSQ